MVTSARTQSPAEKKSNDSKGLHSSPSAASMDSKADQRRLTVKALGSRGLPNLKLPNQRCQAQRFEIADFLFGRALSTCQSATTAGPPRSCPRARRCGGRK